MKKLNNIYSYGEFIDVHNEGIWSAIKGMFKALFAKVSKSVETKINNFTAKVENVKDWKTIQKTMTDEVAGIQKWVDEQLPNVTDLIGVRKVNYDVYDYLYIISADVSKKLNQDALKPSVFFKDVEPKGIFDHPTPDEFDKNLITALNTLITGQATKAGFTPDEIKKLTDEKEIPKELEAAKPAEPAEGETTPPAKPAEQQGTEQQGTEQQGTEQQTGTQGAEKQNSSVEYSKDEQLFEADAPAPAGKGDIAKLKELTKTDLTNMLGTISNKYKNYKYTGGVDVKTSGNLTNYTGKDASGAVVTTYPDTVRKMAQGIRGMNKDQLLKLRKAQQNILGKPGDGKDNFGAL